MNGSIDHLPFSGALRMLILGVSIALAALLTACGVPSSPRETSPPGAAAPSPSVPVPSVVASPSPTPASSATPVPIPTSVGLSVTSVPGEQPTLNAGPPIFASSTATTLLFFTQDRATAGQQVRFSAQSREAPPPPPNAIGVCTAQVLAPHTSATGCQIEWKPPRPGDYILSARLASGPRATALVDAFAPSTPLAITEGSADAEQGQIKVEASLHVAGALLPPSANVTVSARLESYGRTALSIPLRLSGTQAGLFDYAGSAPEAGVQPGVYDVQIGATSKNGQTGSIYPPLNWPDLQIQLPPRSVPGSPGTSTAVPAAPPDPAVVAHDEAAVAAMYGNCSAFNPDGCPFGPIVTTPDGSGNLLYAISIQTTGDDCFRHIAYFFDGERLLGNTSQLPPTSIGGVVAMQAAGPRRFAVGYGVSPSKLTSCAENGSAGKDTYVYGWNGSRMFLVSGTPPVPPEVIVGSAADR